jgi:Spy/CpxP family protein refolding chaperone
MRIATIIAGACLLAATTALYAQTTPAPADAGKGAPRQGRMQHYDCSKTTNPQACEERRTARRAKMRETHETALKACESQKGDAHRDCMIKQGCAASKDAAKCEAGAQKRAEKQKQRREQGDKK